LGYPIANLGAEYRGLNKLAVEQRELRTKLKEQFKTGN